MTDPRPLTTCRICGGPVETVLDLGAQPPATVWLSSPDEPCPKFWLRINLCKPCIHLQNSLIFDQRLPCDDWEVSIRDGNTITFPYAGDLWNRGIYDWFMHERPSLMGLTAMTKLVENHGLTLGEPGNFDLMGQRVTATLTSDGSHQALAELERLQRHDHPARWVQVKSRVEDHKARLTRRIETCKCENIVGYGACPEGNTILNYTGLGERLACIVDDELAGKFAPGSKLPIVRRDAIEAPEAFVVLDWRKLGEIQDREKGFEGVWIHPMMA